MKRRGLVLLVAIQIFSAVSFKLDDFVGQLFTRQWIQDLDFTPVTSVVEGSRCKRECVAGEQPLVCRFHFTLEHYHTMGSACGDCPANVSACFLPQCVPADGVARGILTVNRKIPGPDIQVCLGDVIVVDVNNHMHGASTTIHWHGIHQEGTPYMDGVPMITQCPIEAGTSFRYAFLPQEAGTSFWHSHDGFQKMDGITGSLIVRRPDDPSRRHYDFDRADHVIMLHDWKNRFFAEYMPGPRKLPRRGQLPDGLLINGRGTRRDPDSSQIQLMPLAEFSVKAGSRFRFRLIHAGCLICPLRFSIEYHALTVIATDGVAVRPVTVDSIMITPGERYDFVVEATQPIRIYWINVVALGECENRNIVQNAIFKYEGAKDFYSTSDFPLSAFPPGLVMNSFNTDCRNGVGICVNQLMLEEPSLEAQTILTATAVTRLTVSFDFHQFTREELFQTPKFYKFYVPVMDDIMVTGRMNNVSFMMPSAPPLSQPEVLTAMCASGSEMCCDNPPAAPSIATHRQCVNIYQVPLGQIVEIVFIDAVDTNGTMAHPIHMHGLSFYVVDIGNAADRAQQRYLFHDMTCSFPALKDTVVVPSNGYAKVRFRATNPGYWLFHCHVLPHSDSGMAAVLQIGTQDQMADIPMGFPKCGNYKPPILVNGIQVIS